MKNAKKTGSLLLALAMIFSLAVPVFAAGVEEKLCAVVKFEDGADRDALCAQLENLPGIRVKWSYEAIFSGVAVEGTESALAAAAECGGVAEVYRSCLWSLPCAEDDPAGTSNSLDVMRSEELAYHGDGMIVAVIDSGFYLSHEAFQDYGIMENPALSREDIDAFTRDGGTEGRYVSQKIPFAYDYNGSDRSVHTRDNHGTHVAALAGGYAEDQNGSVKFKGVASAAQLLCMKVFPDDADLGANDADILKAMDDALLLGADVVNLSLGTEGDFLTDSEIGALYQTSIAALREAGVVVCCAAGNSGNALTGKQSGMLYPTGEFTDYGTACSPAAFEGTVAVGAVNSVKEEVGGGIVVDGVAIGYVKAISENDEEILPDLDDLRGQSLTYVMVGGLGRKSDFEELDLSGCVAVVQRGEIYFTEKVNNAAAAGAVACLICNNEPGAILPAVNGTTIPCVLITQEAGEFMAQHTRDGRGNLVIAPEKMMVSTGESLSMMEQSSWGATSRLGFLATLCAPGGKILSAVTEEKDAYGYLSGTSMATPNASGAFAVLMQALGERGIDDKLQRAMLAEALLQSTATLVTDENGTPLSPRRQGAGVIDLASAIESRVVIENPILELGDGLINTLRISFDVRNLSSEAVELSIDPTVLTDAFGIQDDRRYSMLSPIDITKYTKTDGDDRVIMVPPEGNKTVRLNLTVEPELIQTLKETYPNGFFLEGYVALKSEEGDAVHAAFIGYRGDWEAAPVIEQVDFRDLMDAAAEGITDSEELVDALGVNMWYNLAYLTEGSEIDEKELLLGENLWGTTASFDDRIAMPTQNSNAHYMAGDHVSIDLYTLRHAAHVIMVVSDRKTGEVYCVDDTAYLPRADFDEKTGLVINSGKFTWDGTDSNGNSLPDGTQVLVEFFAWTESDTDMQTLYAERNSSMEKPSSYRWLISGLYDNVREWWFPLVIDSTSPEISAKIDDETGKLLLTLKEDEFLAYAAVQDGLGNVYADEVFDSEVRGKDYTIAIDFPEEEPQCIYVVLSDYASNTVGYCVDLSAILETGTPEIQRCPAAMFQDVNKEAWYHEAVDFVCEAGIMDGTGVSSFAPEAKVSRAAVVDVLYRIAGMPEIGDAAIPFKDVQSHLWYYDALLWAYSEGIITGYDESTVGALVPVSRQQMAVMIYRMEQLRNGHITANTESLEKFVDGADVAVWAKDAMAWAVSEGLLSGDNNGRLNPNANMSRAEMAQIVMNYYLNKN